ncbi:MAG: helix-hairpin-helix domain-containing protein [Trueperella sp.]|uniref:helix-hairpin-helix domain-containing protein n=1 Tax=Trueperella sp. TaxID=2699835 RepID=UPI00260138A0|nr:helix-hairpin-helix domain-containing protein [Trueperella sp.]MCI7305365.1 helix-hairpin-helix domain-containing protein [Trueperella sp.]
MTTLPPRRPTSRQSRETDWGRVEGFARTAMRVGAGDDVGALTSHAKKRRFVLDGNSLRLAAVLLLVLALSGVIGALSGRSTEVAAIAPVSETSAPRLEAGGRSADGEAESGNGDGAGGQPGADSASAATPSGPSDSPGVNPEAIVVHVSGQVSAPGVVTLPAPARVTDAVQAAGGPTDEADLARINLAEPISDGVHIHVPALGEAFDVTDAGAGAGAGAEATTGGDDGKVNINTADQAGLEAIPGVGPVTAQAIIDWRTENGAFTSIDQLVEVRGIGPKTFERLREHVRV